MRPKRSATIPAGLLGMLILVGGLEMAFGGHVYRSIRFESSWVWHQAGKRSLRDVEILCFGDSQIKNGVHPAVIEAVTGRKTYNLALNGAQVPASYLLFKRALENGSSPRAVVVGFMPAPLARGCDFRSVSWLPLAGPGDWLELADWGRHPANAAEATLKIAVPSIRERREIRAEILASLRGEPNAPGSAFPRDFLNAFQRRNWSANLGAQVLPDYNVRRDPEVWYRVDYPGPWSVDPMIAGYLRRFLDLAESRGIRVYWLLHPVDPEGQAILDREGQEDRFGRFLAGLLGRYRNLSLIDGHHSFYDRSAFTDMVHLHERGASALSLVLAEVLRDEVPESRFLTLPPYSPGPSVAPLEDLNRSIVAVREQRRGDRPEARTR